MKMRFLSLLLAAALCVGLVACGSDGVPEETPSHAPAAPESSVTPEPTSTPTPEPVVIPLSDGVDVSAWQAENTSDLMDLAYYLGDELEVGGLGPSGNAMVRGFKWEEEFYPVLEEYAALLCTQYDFEQVGETYNSAGFFDIVLRYTGDKPGLEQSQGGLFSENPGDVVIWGTTKYGKIEGALYFDPALTTGDDGWRHGQAERVCTQPGASAGAGLEYFDGVYYTTDGRLSTTLDHAAMILDGKIAEYDAHYEISSSGDRLTVRVEDKYGNDIQVFYVPSLTGWPDGFAPAADYVREDSFALNCKGVRDTYPAYNWKTMFTTVHDGMYVYPIQGLSGEMTGLAFRVMYLDEEVAVFYTCATFRSEPAVIETLIAVNVDVEPDVPEDQSSSGSGSDPSASRCSGCSGSGSCRECGGSGRVSEWMGDQYMNLTCTRCSGSGNCSQCGGSGKG